MNRKVQAGSLRAPQPRAREKTRSRKRQFCIPENKKRILVHRNTRIPSGCCRPEIPGVSQVKMGEHRRSYTWNIYEPTRTVCEVRWCCVAAAVAVIPLLYCAGALEVQRKCRLESSSWLYSGWCAHMIRTHAHTQAPFVAVTTRRP